ncbi:hypothetical protein ACX5I6_16055 [Arthrobacter sp. MMS24-T111]
MNSCRTLVLTDAGSSGNPWNRAVDLTVTGAGRERTGDCSPIHGLFIVVTGH